MALLLAKASAKLRFLSSALWEMGEGGFIEALYIAPEAKAPMQAVESAHLIAGCGIEGDRYWRGAGTFSHWPRDHELTLVEAEVIESVTAEWSLTFTPGETRRNIVTRDIRLNPLVGRRFRIGNALCIGTRLCEPCAHLEKMTGKGGLARMMVHRGGLRARILEDGTIRIGDRLIPEESDRTAEETSE